jgi:intracellular sulfur oxidation DsrE/DsrF family protein
MDGDSQLYVCKINLKNHGIPENQLLDVVKVITLPAISEFMMERETHMC